MTEPFIPTALVFKESDLISRMEYLPYPAVMADFHFNLGNEVMYHFIRRLMDKVIGPCILAGFQVTESGGTVALSPGEMLVRNLCIIKSTPTTFTHITDDYWVAIRVSILRYTGNSFTVPSSGTTLAGANQYRAVVSYEYLPIASFADPGGSGGDGYFVSSFGWVADSQVGKAAEFYDSNDQLVLISVVESNDVTTLSFKGDATGAVKVKLDNCVLVAKVDSTGTVTDQLPVITSLYSSRTAW